MGHFQTMLEGHLRSYECSLLQAAGKSMTDVAPRSMWKKWHHAWHDEELMVWISTYLDRNDINAIYVTAASSYEMQRVTTIGRCLCST